MNDIPQLVQQSNDGVIFQNKSQSDKTEFELHKEKQFPEKPVILSKKRKLARNDSNMDLTNLQDEVERNNTLSSHNPNCLQQLDLIILVCHCVCDANNFEKDGLERNNDTFVCDENLSNTLLHSKDQNSQDWWQICQYTCLSCKAENIIEQFAVKACCN